MIFALGVVGDESDEAYIESIQAMEIRDCEGRRARMADQHYHFQII